MSVRHRAACRGAVRSLSLPVSADESAGPHYVPYNASSIYALDETVGWHVTLPWSSPPVSYVIRKNNLAEIGRGSIKPGIPAKIEAKLDEPGMVYVEITENAPRAPSRVRSGAVVAPGENRRRRFRNPRTSTRSGRRRSRRCARCPRSPNSPRNPARRTVWTSPSSR